MECGRDEEDSTAWRGTLSCCMFFCCCDEVREAGFRCVVRADQVDIDDCLEGVAAELGHGSEEVSCCAGNAKIYAAKLFEAAVYCGLEGVDGSDIDVALAYHPAAGAGL